MDINTKEDLINEIRSRIKNEKSPLGYEGFDMSGDGFERNNKLIKKFDDLCFNEYDSLERKMYYNEEIFVPIFWKGCGTINVINKKNTYYFDDTCYFNWTTEEILLDIILLNNPKLRNKLNIIPHNLKVSIRKKEELELELSILEEETKKVFRIVDKKTRYKVLNRQKWLCNSCHCKLKFSKDSNWDGEVAHIDHIHPFSKKHLYVNGAQNINEESNLQGLCPKCNLLKGKKEMN